jgi:CubicO group peptidase (beta-lactamase class C family)
VLARLAERVGGQSYERQLAEHIFGPLGLTHTSLPAGNEPLPDVHGYVGLGAHGKSAASAPIDSAALSPYFAWRPAASTGSGSSRRAGTPTSGEPPRRRSPRPAAAPGATAATSPATWSSRCRAATARARRSCP